MSPSPPPPPRFLHMGVSGHLRCPVFPPNLAPHTPPPHSLSKHPVAQAARLGLPAGGWKRPPRASHSLRCRSARRQIARPCPKRAWCLRCRACHPVWAATPSRRPLTTPRPHLLHDSPHSITSPDASRGFPVSRGEAGVFTVACEAPHNQVPACPLSLAHRAPATLGLLLFQHSRHSELRSDVTSSEKPSLTITSSKQPHECFPFVRPPCPELPHETADFLRAATWGSLCSLARSRRSGCSANTRPSFFSSRLQ